ncbi:SPFH domain-containing protein [Chitinibacter sp. GC72]|uniref:SPFH domain-containing protein n=1 Tax=Chitinibacter sp. GC72 TaxID=1526917 RepID=UPI0012F80326|nr:slipin family protein [Chitinibacter sp. GC72]
MGLEFSVIFFAVVIIFIAKSFKIVPQQSALIIERLGRFRAVLAPGLNWVIPFVDRVAYKHSLKEIPLDVPSQVCITRDNTQLQVDGILYFQVLDPRLASYGTSDYVLAISQLAQTTLRSVIGKLELDKTFEERDDINRTVVAALDEAATSWGVKVLRYEIKDLTPPQAILHSMQQQITAEREKRARIAQSEGVKQEQINLATGQREAAIQKSQGDMQAAINQSEGERQAQINRATGEAEALRLVAHATAEAIGAVAKAIEQPGGVHAINLKVAEQYVSAFGNIAKEGNTMLLPGNAADVSSMIATAMNVVQAAKK